MARARTKPHLTREEAIKLLESIQRRMEGTTEEEALAAVASARAEIRRAGERTKLVTSRSQEHKRRRPASA